MLKSGKISKKILIVLVNIENGGVESFLSNVLTNIKKEHLIIDVAYNKNSKNSIFFNKIKEQVRYCFSYGGSLCYSPFFYLPKLLFYILKYGKYDIVHCNSGSFNGIVLFLALLIRIKKRISHLHMNDIRGHGIKSLIKRPLKFLNKYCGTAFFITSSDIKSSFCINKNFYYLKNGIDIYKFSYNYMLRNKVRSNYSLNDKFVIGHVGRFDNVKNYPFLIDIFNEIYKRKGDSVLFLIGDGIDSIKAKIEKKVGCLKLDSNVIFAGAKKNIYDYYQAMDCFVFPSLNEGLGIVAIEAQCSGLPCFISDGVPDEAMICNTTKISLSKSAKEWADIILEKTENFERKDCSIKIKQAGFDIKDTIKKIENIYSKK